MTPDQKDVLTKQFIKDVYERANEIDPENEHYWLSLTFGWAIAKGLTPNDAMDFSIYIRYKTPYG